MAYLTQGRPAERIDKLITFKYKADVDLVLYWHYKSILDELLEGIQLDTTSGIRIKSKPQEDFKG